jgi:branched-subunit amino acid transport protein
VSGTVLWATVVAASLGCYLLKLAGLSVPASWVEQPWVARVVDFVPAALLAALVAVQGLTSGHDLAIDGRLAGLAVAAVALALRAPFIVVLVLAGAAGALAHVLTG